MTAVDEKTRRTTYEVTLKVPIEVMMSDAKKLAEQNGSFRDSNYTSRELVFDMRCYWPHTVAETVAEMGEQLGCRFPSAVALAVTPDVGDAVDEIDRWFDEWSAGRTFEQLYDASYVNLAATKFVQEYNSDYPAHEVVEAMDHVALRWGHEYVTMENVLAELDYLADKDKVVDAILDDVGQGPADINGYVGTEPFGEVQS